MVSARRVGVAERRALDLAAVVQAACSDAAAANERRKLLGWLADARG
jgi:hypothetical protein